MKTHLIYGLIVLLLLFLWQCERKKPTEKTNIITSAETLRREVKEQRNYVSDKETAKRQKLEQEKVELSKKATYWERQYLVLAKQASIAETGYYQNPTPQNCDKALKGKNILIDTLEAGLARCRKTNQVNDSIIASHGREKESTDQAFNTIDQTLEKQIQETPAKPKKPWQVHAGLIGGRNSKVFTNLGPYGTITTPKGLQIIYQHNLVDQSHNAGIGMKITFGKE